MTKTKIAKAAGKFGVRYGQHVRRRIAAIEGIQRKKQICPFCNGIAKRLSKGIWECNRCRKRFAGHAYYLDKQKNKIEENNAKVLKNENPIRNYSINSKSSKKIKE